MSEEEVRKLQEYNNKYTEAMISEEVFGGDHTSSVELEYANKLIEQLQQENEKLKEDNRMLEQDAKCTYDTCQEMLAGERKIINELESSLEKEIKRTDKLLDFDFECNMLSTHKIRKMLNEDRKCWLNKLKELKGDGDA